MKNLFTQYAIPTLLFIICFFCSATAMQENTEETTKQGKYTMVIINVDDKEATQKIVNKINQEIEDGYPICTLSPEKTSNWCKKMNEWCDKNQIKTNIEKKK